MCTAIKLCQCCSLIPLMLQLLCYNSFSFGRQNIANEYKSTKNGEMKTTTKYL